jgi:hypothetical protein
MQNDDVNLPWIDSPFFNQRLADSHLDEPTRAMVKFYADNGYLIIDPEISDVDGVAQEIVGACTRDPEYQQRLLDEWERVPAIRRLAVTPKILSTLRTLYGRDPIPMQTLNFGRGTQQRPHSDSVHFSSVPQGFMCGVWIALEDIDETNGPLEYYPGSHRLPYLDFSNLGITGSDQREHEFYPRYERFIQSCIRELSLERRTLSIPKGQAIIWAANLLHGGSAVTDPTRTRHSQVTHYYFADCLYYHPYRSDPFLGKIQWLDKRDIRTGQFIPQIYNGRAARLPLSIGQRMKGLVRRSGLAAQGRRWKTALSRKRSPPA